MVDPVIQLLALETSAGGLLKVLHQRRESGVTVVAQVDLVTIAPKSGIGSPTSLDHDDSRGWYGHRGRALACAVDFHIHDLFLLTFMIGQGIVTADNLYKKGTNVEKTD
jgi:hypothetical protein